jgi:hypothetical protein
MSNSIGTAVTVIEAVKESLAGAGRNDTGVEWWSAGHVPSNCPR